MTAINKEVQMMALFTIKQPLWLETKGLKSRVPAKKSAQGWLDRLDTGIKLPRRKDKAYEVFSEWVNSMLPPPRWQV